ncbi:MaoC family dehydratase [Bauldia sp.]|uniref:MaoC family dehydratase n=1 Tax=Bauldia sp. TaxID=2575872 RepID=UPI003BAC6181
MGKKYFEDFSVGDVFALPERRVERGDIIAFAATYDPQPYHLDERAPATDLGGGLSASGWHVCALFMRMLCDGFLLETTCAGSPGIETLKWRRPVRPGDRLKGRSKVLDARTSRSRPNLGIIRFRHEVENHGGETVMWLEGPILFERRATR